MQLSYHILDVFTEHALSGNPLAVVLAADGLTPSQMQAIAGEFNLSETVFMLEPRDPINTARIRIFTPTRELPFAGHPTVGTAVLLGHLRAPEMILRHDVSVVIEEEIGIISCTVRQPRGKAARASFDLVQEPESCAEPTSVPLIAQALGLGVGDIGFDQHMPTVFTAGVPFTFVPVRHLAAMARIAPLASMWTGAFGPDGQNFVYAYTREVIEPGNAFHARMFFPEPSLREDPATGSAVAAFGGVIMRFEPPPDGDHALIIEQGFEMGRPSLITLGLEVAQGTLTGASIGGAAIMFASGTLQF